MKILTNRKQKVEIKQINLLDEYQHKSESLQDLSKHISREVSQKLDRIRFDNLTVNYFYPVALQPNASLNYGQVVAAGNQQQLTVNHEPQVLQDAYQFYQFPMSDHFDRDLQTTFPLLDITQLSRDVLQMHINKDDEYDYDVGLINSKALEIKLSRKRLIQGSVVVAAKLTFESMLMFIKIHYQINPISLNQINLWINQSDAIVSVISTDKDEFGYTNLDNELRKHIDCVASDVISGLTDGERFSLTIKKAVTDYSKKQDNISSLGSKVQRDNTSNDQTVEKQKDMNAKQNNQEVNNDNASAAKQNGDDQLQRQSKSQNVRDTDINNPQLITELKYTVAARLNGKSHLVNQFTTKRYRFAHPTATVNDNERQRRKATHDYQFKVMTMQQLISVYDYSHREETKIHRQFKQDTLQTYVWSQLVKLSIKNYANTYGDDSQLKINQLPSLVIQELLSDFQIDNYINHHYDLIDDQTYPSDPQEPVVFLNSNLTGNDQQINGSALAFLTNQAKQIIALTCNFKIVHTASGDRITLMPSENQNPVISLYRDSNRKIEELSTSPRIKELIDDLNYVYITHILKGSRLISNTEIATYFERTAAVMMYSQLETVNAIDQKYIDNTANKQLANFAKTITLRTIIKHFNNRDDQSHKLTYSQNNAMLKEYAALKDQKQPTAFAINQSAIKLNGQQAEFEYHARLMQRGSQNHLTKASRLVNVPVKCIIYLTPEQLQCRVIIAPAKETETYSYQKHRLMRQPSALAQQITETTTLSYSTSNTTVIYNAAKKLINHLHYRLRHPK